jgi:hypothetical protein
VRSAAALAPRTTTLEFMTKRSNKGGGLRSAAAFAWVAIAACSSPGVSFRSPTPTSTRTELGPSTRGAGGRSVILRNGVPRTWSDDRVDAAWDLVRTTVRSEQPRSAILLGVGGGSAARDFAHALGRNAVIVEPDPTVREQASALGVSPDATLLPGEGAVTGDARFDVVLVDANDDRLALDAEEGARVRRWLTPKGLVIVRRLASPSDPRMASALQTLGVGLPFRRLVGSAVEDVAQDLLLVLSRRPIRGALVYSDVPRVELALPEGHGHPRELGAIRSAAESHGLTTRIGYLGHHRDRLVVGTPCPDNGSTSARLTGLGAVQLAETPTGHEHVHATSDDRVTALQTLLGADFTDDCVTTYSDAAVAVEGIEATEGELAVSRVLFTLDAAEWMRWRNTALIPRVHEAATAVVAHDFAAAVSSLSAALSDLEKDLGPAVRSTQGFDATLTMREIVLAHAEEGGAPSACARMFDDANLYAGWPSASLEDLARPGNAAWEPTRLDALRLREAFARCATSEP